MTADDNLSYFSTRTTAEIFELSVQTIRDWCEEGRFPHAFKLGRSWRIPRSDIEIIANSKHGDPK